MPHDDYKSLYIHIPYCVQKCNYCDFCSRVRDPESAEVKEYIEKLVGEIRKFSKEGELGGLETIYIGGGTPSYIGSKNLSSLLYALSLSINLEKIQEFSIEANPESLNEELVKDVWALGTNRLSIGVQSFDNDILQMLGRAHDSQTAKKAIENAKIRFKNISIDLMCGIPGQSIETFEKSLQTAIDLNLPHISIYPLSIEYNTVFYKWKAQGKIDDINQDVQADHMELAANMLKNAGYVHYEVSSYAKPGFESKHNLSYWTGKPYLGLGESATTMTQNSERRMRVTDQHVEDDLDSKQMIAEDLMLSMRTCYGANAELVASAKENFTNFGEVIDHLIDYGLVQHKDSNIVPTKKGWLCGNELYSKLLDLAN